MLHALVGDVVIESRKIEGKKRPEMIAKFRIDGIPALAVLERGKGAGADDPTVGMWELVNFLPLGSQKLLEKTEGKKSARRWF